MDRQNSVSSFDVKFSHQTTTPATNYHVDSIINRRKFYVSLTVRQAIIDTETTREG